MQNCVSLKLEGAEIVDVSVLSESQWPLKCSFSAEQMYVKELFYEIGIQKNLLDQKKTISRIYILNTKSLFHK